jgi:hypothetical protein
VHELIHALEQRRGWYITNGVIQDLEKAEALSYATEYMLQQASIKQTSFPDMESAGMQTIAAANNRWDAAWGKMQSIVATPTSLGMTIFWYTGPGGFLEHKRPAVSADIDDVRAKLGLFFSESAFRYDYVEMLGRRAVPQAQTLHLRTTTQLSTCFR